MLPPNTRLLIRQIAVDPESRFKKRDTHRTVLKVEILVEMHPSPARFTISISPLRRT
jgi:hypothetical protein